MLLIRAEAALKQNKLDNAVIDVNAIRARAGLADYAGSVTAEAIEGEINHQRQSELFTEWGHRWLDLKRTGNIDAVMNAACTLKGGSWKSEWQLYPISLTELQRGVNLFQNQGY